uniref:Beta-1,4-N-acetylgalactosaminyltransferase n=1 Tax=Astatotilapia calliptera TaxID=8154 RepID=A0AAX7T9N3_ASTCA
SLNDYKLHSQSSFYGILCKLVSFSHANLHVFEDWCGSSTADLRKNLHYPLYPHSRTTVEKLAVSPQWTNYGLRIFGYLHPHTDGDFVFAVSSDDNSEFWLSTDDSPLNLKLIAWVGMTGKEWTAPGEFEKYSSQTSRPVWLSAQRRYFFEVIHKQNDEGTDHVEVAWLQLDYSSLFKVIDSKYISLYTNESALSMNDVAHIPQTAASHRQTPTKQRSADADMLIEDRRDSFYKGQLRRVLPDCSYNPSYTIKDFPLLRYQGLQFVHLSYIYPNDYTRLTHMETQTSCFYSESSYYLKSRKRVKRKRVKAAQRPGQNNLPILGNKKDLKANQQPVVQSEQLGSKQDQIQKFGKTNNTEIQRLNNSQPEKPPVAKQRRFVTKQKELQLPNSKRFTPPKRDFNHPLKRSNQRDLDGNIDKRWSDRKEGEEDELSNRAEKRKDTTEGEKRYFWERQEDFEGTDDEDLTPAPVFDTQVNWNQTFHVNHLDLQAQRSDWIDLQCNISGNLLLHSNDALPIVKITLHFYFCGCSCRRFKLVRVVNMVKRVDDFQGSRYLLELELKDVNGQLLRVSHYIYALVTNSWSNGWDSDFQQSKSKTLLCNPVGFRWNPVAMVHFIVPVKNQARWVQQLITDMEELFKITGDSNFNLIITDYKSTDMDVRKALEKSSLPRYQYVKMDGNFERSAGLQAGIDLITDDHSIVFLCDLHIHFPPSIIDTIRMHCVEGYMAFAPIVMRLGCGNTPLEARGYWEINGFGLLGIYKSDLDTVGGMNTKEFTDRWGGEDWELLDRILEAGLEVERIYLRNFFHHYHSKRGMWNRRMSTSPR